MSSFSRTAIRKFEELFCLQAKSDTSGQTNRQSDPKKFSTLGGLPGVQNNDPVKSPTETGPDSQAVGRK